MMPSALTAIVPSRRETTDARHVAIRSACVASLTARALAAPRALAQDAKSIPG
jgi:hypothetical protein